ncbi:uncharacterized protein EDB91DRAFT_1081218 [Suillus paluster]|uniref:uncharacterized protein n=1 Tax=Suillus paluster TaxID=48578 RepID=UPI001B87E9E7|nr:uncharacterized protein EDB91DRAFT_1081218 [Suillus paluster]KAG1743283.1 hypothetical protein EDB91DRAFT_1081218 [Suillus paluster]
MIYQTYMKQQLQDQLVELQLCLKVLPMDIPVPLAAESRYKFSDFSTDAEWAVNIGEAGAVNRELEVRFGSCVDDLKLMERGPETEAVVDVLETWIEKCPGDIILEKWLPKSSHQSNVHPDIELVSSQSMKASKKKKSNIESDTSVMHLYTDTKQIPAKGKGGAKVDPLMDLLSDPQKMIVWCAGAEYGCATTWAAPHWKTRVFGHALPCGKLNKINLTLWDRVRTAMAKESLGDRVEALKDQLDFDVLKLICIGGIPLTKVDSTEWKTMWKHGNPDYEPASCAVLTKSQIPNEAARIEDLQLQHLHTCDNLTITFDGNTTKLPESVYTIHVITPVHWVFLVEGDESSEVSHTGAKIHEVLKKVGAKHFSGVASDNTGNTTLACSLLQDEFSWIIILPDSCHRMSSLCKDIGDQEDTLNNQDLQIKRGLVSVGKTRFGTIYHSGESLHCCLKPIRQLCTEKIINIPEVNNYFIKVLAPIAKAITCLESTHSTVSDVYLFWFAVTVTIHQIITKDITEFRGADILLDLNPLAIARIKIGGQMNHPQDKELPDSVYPFNCELRTDELAYEWWSYLDKDHSGDAQPLAVKTLVRTVQIHSWYKHNPSAPPPKKKPTVKWRNMSSTIFGGKRKRGKEDENDDDDETSDVDDNFTDELEAGPDEDNNDSDLDVADPEDIAEDSSSKADSFDGMADAALDEAERELRDLAEDLDIKDEQTRGEWEGKEDDNDDIGDTADGWINEVARLPMADHNELEENIRPVKLVLVKVSHQTKVL